MIEDIKETTICYMKDFNLIITRINECFKEERIFILKDLLNGDKYNTYWIRDTRGYLQTLINFGYIEIHGKIGNNNFIYKAIKEIPKNYER